MFSLKSREPGGSRLATVYQGEPERAREGQREQGSSQKEKISNPDRSDAAEVYLILFASTFATRPFQALTRKRLWQILWVTLALSGLLSGSLWLSCLLLLWHFAYTIQSLLGSQRRCHADTLIRAPFELLLVARNLRNEMTLMILEFTNCFKTWLLTFYIDLWKEKSLTKVKFVKVIGQLLKSALVFVGT